MSATAATPTSTMSTTKAPLKVCVVIGVGPGIGRSVALRFARAGYAIALCARSYTYSEPIRNEIDTIGGTSLSVNIDASDPVSVSTGFATIRRLLSPHISILIYNAAVRRISPRPAHQLPIEEFEKFWKINCYGAFLCAREVLNGSSVDNDIGMIKRGEGTMLFSGATGSVRCLAGMSSFSVGKFGLRALAQSLHGDYAKYGIHVAHIIIDGPVDNPLIGGYVRKQWAKTHGEDNKGPPEGVMLQPDDLAEVYWQLHAQPKSTWTHELDVRPSLEKMTSKL